MKGSNLITDALNAALASEFRAIAQYRQDAAVLDNMGLPALAKTVRGYAVQEQEHLDELLARIAFLQGKPTFQPTGTEYRGTVSEIIDGNLELEIQARNEYQDLVDLARGERDEKTALLAGDTEGDEEEHINFWEGERDILRVMGEAAYLTAWKAKA